MSDKFAPLRGMRDILHNELCIYKYIEELAYKVATLYGYKSINTPILENSAIFNKTLGDTSDVVSKEIYTFQDKKNRDIALRPEFTASIVRAFISNGLNQSLPQKLFCSGPLFRYDRPQKGRQRQFHQLNFEHIGAAGAYSDAEIISLASSILERLDTIKNTKLELNSLGCDQSKKSYQLALQEYFKKYYNDLSDDSKNRIETNPLRILDSKSTVDHVIIADAPEIHNYYTLEASKYFDLVQNYLHVLNIDYVINTKLARGLDYYSHTIFEFTTSKLGSQSAVIAGGRYNDLVSIMGGDNTPAIGFAIGLERLSMISDINIPNIRNNVIIPMSSDVYEYAIDAARHLRQNNIPVILELSDKKISKQMQLAVSKNYKFVIFIGPEEKKNNTFKIKNLDSCIQQNVDLHHLTKALE